MNRFSVLTGIPETTKGLVRELRVRWMLEELGLPFEEVRYPHPETKKEDYLKKQPFGQVPYFESGDLCMFETGAILLHLAMKYNKFLSTEEHERAHTLSWMFAAFNSMEPFFFHNFLTKRDADAGEGSKERAFQLLKDRLQVASKALGDKDFFSGSFSIAEIVMTTVLRIAKSQGYLGEYKNLCNYLERIEARPAFQRALNEHVKLYEEKK
jgi:glutathione S-transferase